MFENPQTKIAKNTKSIFNQSGNLSVPEGEKIRGIKPSRADDSLCSPIEDELIKNAPLFEHPPCVDDINQDTLGDCYLLATLISLINSPKYGPEFIMNMMHDNGDGTVTVRMHKFDVDLSSVDDIKNIRAVYCRVKKGVARNSSSALWVQTIENAYARLGCNRNSIKQYEYPYNQRKYRNDKYNKKLNKIRQRNDLKGGASGYSFFALTGNIADNFDTDTECSDFIKNFNEGKAATINFKERNKFITNNHVYSIYNIFKKDNKQYITIINPWECKYTFEDYKKGDIPKDEPQGKYSHKVITLLVDNELLDNVDEITFSCEDEDSPINFDPFDGEFDDFFNINI